MAFRNSFKKQNLSPREKYANNYKSGRAYLLMVAILTVISIITTLVTENGTYFIFSAGVPRFLVLMGKILCGKFADFDYSTLGFEDFEPFPDGVLITLTVIALVITALYVLCWFFSSRGRVVFMIIGLVLFCIDTLAMLVLFAISEILIDIKIDVTC